MTTQINRQFRTTMLGLFMAGFIALLPQQVLAQTVPPATATAFVQGLGQKAISILSQPSQTMAHRETAFRVLISDAFKMDFIARFALGKYWRRTDPAQQQEYVLLFGNYIVKTYGVHLASYSGEQFKIKGVKAVGKRDVMVRSQIVRPGGGPAITADWRLRAFPGGPRIIDVMIEGVSMGVTQRDEFSSVVSRSGIDGLLEVLRARTQSLSVSAPGQMG